VEIQLSPLFLQPRLFYRVSYRVIDNMDSTSFATKLTGGLKAALSPANLLSVVVLWLLYHAAKAIYNISPLHPLYQFPGSKMAAMGYWTEAYYDFWLGGRYSREIKRMHEKYGK
jgi:hypothetical protein